MNPYPRYFQHLSLTIFALMTLVAQAALAQKVVHLVAGERPPYIGSALPRNGYAFEVAEEAFKRKGYQVKLTFMPWARANFLVTHGDADAMLPVDNDERRQANQGQMFSEPFPGGTIGFLKKKSLLLPELSKYAGEPAQLLNSLKSYRFGALNSGVSMPAFEDVTGLYKEFVNADIQNLDKISAGRIDLMLVDKYTAADLMVGERPNLIGQLEFVKPAMARGSFYLAFSKAAPRTSDLLHAFNDGLSEMQQDGTIEKVLAKHGLSLLKQEKKGNVQLTIGTVNNSDMVVMQKLSNEFKKLFPHISLNWRVLDENTLRLRLLSDLAISDGQFDVMTIGTYEAPIWAKLGWITPLTGLPDKYDINDLIPAVRQALSHNDQLYALPFYAEGAMTYYRKDLFAKAGLVMPAQPTYQEILTFAAKVHDPSNGTYGLCLRGKPGWGENMAFVSQLVHSFGGRWFDEQWHAALNTPAWESALAFYFEALRNYGPPLPERNGFNENLALFSDGHCAMWIDATVAAGLLFDSRRSKVSAELGFVDAPSGAAGKGAWLWSWALAIPNSSTHKAEALQFIAWATSKNYLQTVAKHHGWVTVPPGTRKSTYGNPAYLTAAPFAKFVREAVESVDVNPAGLKPSTDSGLQYVAIPEFAGLANQVGLELVKILRKEKSIAAALLHSQALIEEQMHRSGYYK